MRRFKILLMVLYLLPLSNPVKAQCTINYSQTSPGIYPDTLPQGTAGQAYNTDVTFVMLTDTLGLTIYNYHIQNISGLPVGLNWQCSNFLNGCNYDPSVSVYGCVNLSGVPLVPGSFIMTVSVVADIQLAGQQFIQFDVPLEILPGTVNNPGFSMQNSIGCAPLTVSFTNNNPGQSAYLWDFGNGLQSNLENPPSQTYTTPGTYAVTQTVSPNATPSWYLTNVTVTSIPNNYGAPFDDPDMYFLLYEPGGAQVYDSRPSINGTFPPESWALPNIPMIPGTYTLHVWDEDGGLFGADDDLGQITFTGQGPSGSATGSVNGASGLLIVNYDIFETPVVPLVATDTIYVYDQAPLPVITSSGPLTVCANDSVTLSVNDSINLLQWYDNGTLLPGENGMNYLPAISGTYSVTATTLNGCSASSSNVQVNINPLPPKPTFFVNGNVFTTGISGVNLQWYLDGLPIPGANSSSFTATVNGTYMLCGSDANGCENCSDSLVFVNTGVLETSDASSPYLFPNPSHGYFTLVYDGDEKPDIRIFDIMGKQIEMEYLSAYHQLRNTLKLNSGIYLVEMISGDKKIMRKLIVE